MIICNVQFNCNSKSFYTLEDNSSKKELRVYVQIVDKITKWLN
nr:MAG TPA: hypothetical protein [Caudoviricetes sp.]